jgi:hypothetical protein
MVARSCGCCAEAVSATEGFILRSDATMSCAVIARIAVALVVSAATPSSRIGREGRTHVRVLIESVRMTSVTMLSAWRLALVTVEGREYAGRYGSHWDTVGAADTVDRQVRAE